MAETSHESGSRRTLKSASELFPDGAPSESVLVYGPTMSGKQTLAFELLAATEASDMRVYVTTTEEVTQARTALAAATTPEISEGTTVIDCLGDSGGTGELHAESPADLLQIAGFVAQLYGDAAREERVGSRLLIDDLSSLLFHTDVGAVTRFLHPLIRKVESEGGLVIATLGTDGLEAAETQAITGLFDSRIEVKTQANQSPACRRYDEETWYQFEPSFEEPR